MDIQPYFWPPPYMYYRNRQGKWSVLDNNKERATLATYLTEAEARRDACVRNCKQYGTQCPEHPQV
jgi:hypothetical protein